MLDATFCLRLFISCRSVVDNPKNWCDLYWVQVVFMFQHDLLTLTWLQVLFIVPGTDQGSCFSKVGSCEKHSIGLWLLQFEYYLVQCYLFWKAYFPNKIPHHSWFKGVCMWLLDKSQQECYETAVCVSSSCLCQLVLLSESTKEWWALIGGSDSKRAYIVKVITHFLILVPFRWF